MAFSALVAAALSMADPGAAIDWDAPAGCPDRAFIVDAVGRLMGRPMEEADVARLQARARVTTRNDGVLRLDLSLRSAVGERERTMLGNTCLALADAVALEVATALDPLAVVDELEEAEVLPADRPYAGPGGVAAPPDPRRGSDRERERPAGPSATPSAPTGPRAGLRVAGVAGYGVFHAVTPAVELMVAVLGRHLRGELGAGYWFNRQIRSAEAPGSGLDVSLVVGRLRGCPVPRLGPLEFPVCVGLDLGGIRAQGVGVSEASTSWRLWAAASVGTGLAWAFSRRVALWVDAGLGVPLWRPAFAIVNLDVGYRVPHAVGWTGLGLEVRLR